MWADQGQAQMPLLAKYGPMPRVVLECAIAHLLQMLVLQSNTRGIRGKAARNKQHCWDRAHKDLQMVFATPTVLGSILGGVNLNG